MFLNSWSTKNARNACRFNFLHTFSEVRFLIFIHKTNYATHCKSWLFAKWLSACSNTRSVRVCNSYTCLNIESNTPIKQQPENSSMLVCTVGPVGILDTVFVPYVIYKRLKHTFYKGNQLLFPQNKLFI
jgi:hypothetical protein